MRYWIARALVGASLLTASAVWAAEAGCPGGGVADYIPSTVSPEAAQGLRRLIAMRASLCPPIATTPAEWRQQFETMEKVSATYTFIDPSRPKIIEEVLGGVPVLRVDPRGPRAGRRALIYLHGGAYTSLSPRSTLNTAMAMADASGLPVFSVGYTIAPEGRWQTVTEQVVGVYRALLATGLKPAAIGMFGDSAGGGLVAASVLKLRDQGTPMPGALVLVSPWSDLTPTGDTYRTLAAAEPMLSLASLQASAAVYAAPADQKNPYVSPVYGDYSKGFPPTLIQGGTKEILLSNFIRQYQAIRSGGGDAVLDLYEGMPHEFENIAPDAPETRTALRRAAAFWADHLADR